ncbi:hypothetical protein F4X86_00465 [Candidatus Saccharibacteria bacterium]|nr:hypothetical protein [Candidatus Saccharibacteria bacterium]
MGKRKNRGQSESWEAARQEKILEIDTLPLTKALLALIRVINQAGQAANRDLVYDIAVAGRSFKPDVRLFRSFGVAPDKDNGVSHADAQEFRIKVAESLAYIQQMDYANYMSGWMITEAGEKILDDYVEENGVLPIDPDEVAVVTNMLR